MKVLIKKIILLLTLLFLPIALWANSPIISGISQNEINIDSNFNGAKVLVFGAKNEAGDIVVVVRGPKKDFRISKKEKFFGIWHNGKQIDFNDTYSFYNLFATFDGKELNKQNLLEFEIGKNNLQLSQNVIFNQKFIDLMEKNNLYTTGTGSIDFLGDTLFKIAIDFPANILEGTYNIEIYLIDNGSIISFQSIPFYVNKIGLSADITKFAQQQKVIYGLLAILIAIVSGFIINFIFNRFFNKYG